MPNIDVSFHIKQNVDTPCESFSILGAVFTSPPTPCNDFWAVPKTKDDIMQPFIMTVYIQLF